MNETSVGRRLWIGIHGAALDDATRLLLEDVRPGGVVLFGRNIESAGQAQGLVAGLRGLLGEDLHVAVDQEGGLVVRFPKELVVWPGNMALGAAAMREPSLGEHLGREQGLYGAAELRELGIDVNLAPVLDLALRGDNPGVGVRSFGAHAELAERLGAALVRGTLEGGVLPCAKHFPGLGEATVDPHLGLPTVATTDLTLQLRPFRGAVAAGVPLVMTSHLVQQALDDEPVTFSARAVDGILRRDLGFRGVVMTDDLEMGAMTRRFAWDDVVRRAAGAGHDVLCICHDAERVRRARHLLAAGLGTGESWFGDPEAVARRLDALRPPAGSDSHDAGQARETAEAIAGRAVSITRDPDARVPFPAGARVLVVVCALRAESGVEDPLRGEDPRALALALGEDVGVLCLDASPDAAAIADAEREAADCDRLVIATTLARFDAGQAALLRRLERHPGSVLVPLRNPFDAEILPADSRCAVVTACGFRAVHRAALADVLRGRRQAYGRLPVALEPLAD